MPQLPESESEALSAYLARIRGKLPSTAANLGQLAAQASAMNSEGVDPEHFQQEFSTLIKSLHVMGVTMDNARKDLAVRTVTGADARSLVEISCTATLADLRVRLRPGAMNLASTELESAIAEAFAAMIAADRDVTLATVEGASSRAAARRQK